MKTNNVKFNDVIIAAGPVIIKDKQVLLNKHGEKNIWKFPGGDITEPKDNLEKWAQRKAGEEMGIEIEILGPLKPMVIWGEDETIILIHYLAEMKSSAIKPAEYIKEYKWIDIDQLPDDCAPNIKPVIDEYKKSISDT